MFGAALLAASIAGFTRPAERAAASVPTCPTGLAPSQSVSPPGGNPFVVCSGRFPSFDGTPIRVDVSLPSVAYIPPGGQDPGPPPLMMFLSGYSNDRCQFESTTLNGNAVTNCPDFIGNAGYHWNNAYFASQGWVVLNYTPRGWYDSCGKVAPGNPYYPEYPSGYSYASDTTCSSTSGEASWVHLYDRRYEIRDAQYLDGLLVDRLSGVLPLGVNPNQIVTTGDSGGGGPSWDQALTQDQVVQLSSTPCNVVTAPWTSPGGTPLHLAAALPLYTWTDLVDSLLPNGTSSDTAPNTPWSCPGGTPQPGSFDSPIGVEKQSYVAGLYALGLSDVPAQPGSGAQYAAPSTDSTADLNKWFAEIELGEPSFGVNPDTPNIVAQVGGPLRSPFAIPVPVNDEKPIFVIQGVTDPLFPALQPLTMINRLKAADAGYPVWAFFGDIGHSYAQNPLDVWQQAHNEGNAWLTSVLAGGTPAQPPITLDTTRCVAGQTLQTYTSSSFSAIATSQMTFSSAPAQTTTSGASDNEGAQTDPIASGGCKTIAASQTSDQPQAIYTFPVTNAFTLVGGPVVNVTANITGTDAELAARLWDVDTSGNSTLVSRTVYRLDEGTSPTTTAPLAFELWPNAWQFQCGHSVKLELTQVDSPTWRPDTVDPTSVSLTNMNLSLPAIQSPDCSLAAVTPEVPVVPLLPAVALPLAVGAMALRRRRNRRTIAQ